jgi:hypothetical protein
MSAREVPPSNSLEDALLEKCDDYHLKAIARALSVWPVQAQLLMLAAQQVNPVGICSSSNIGLPMSPLESLLPSRSDCFSLVQLP